MPALIVFIGCLLALNLWLTRRVLRAPDEQLDKKWLLVAGIWVMPAMGAWLAWDQLRARVAGVARPAERAEQEAWSRALQNREPAPERVRAADAPAAADAPDAPHAADFDLHRTSPGRTAFHGSTGGPSKRGRSRSSPRCRNTQGARWNSAAAPGCCTCVMRWGPTSCCMNRTTR
jgi:hypothetical protein